MRCFADASASVAFEIELCAEINILCLNLAHFGKMAYISWRDFMVASGGEDICSLLTCYPFLSNSGAGGPVASSSEANSVAGR
jgi:hypothetical protein